MKTSFLFKRVFIMSLAVMVMTMITISCTNSNAKDSKLSASFAPIGDAGFLQQELAYSLDALEPYIDKETMEVHYGKHHAGYTKKFNAALNAANIESRDIIEIFSKVSEYPAAVRNNGGGYYNHSLYWNFISPDGGGEPSGELKKALEQNFGSVEEFKTLFSNAAASHFGSGWAWLVLLEDGKLAVTSTSNQDNPLMDIAEVKGRPLLNIDVWEHAYYLNYQNKRKEYITNYWNIVNWDLIESLYLEPQE